MSAETTATPQQPDLNTIKQRQRQVWGAGDFNEIGTRLVLTGELLCEAIDLRAGQKVLDVASGTGNTALAAARRFCEVTSSDFVPALLDRGRIRAKAEGLPITFEVADAEQLPYADASFDVVVSTFGALFAPNQEQVARETLRVCRPGGKIGMANWTPDGFIGDMIRATGAYMAPPPGAQSPLLWGTAERLRELFGAGVSSLDINRRSSRFRYLSAEHHVSFMRTYFGPFKTVYAMLEPADQERLANDMLEICRRFNTSGDDTLAVPATYLEVVAVRA